MAVHPKFFFFDVGVYRGLRPSGHLDAPEEIEGASLETLVLQELKAVNEYYDYDYNFFFWRTASGLEVDIVMYGPRGLLAFEIKRSKRWSANDLKSLTAFKKDYPVARLLFLYGGNRREYVRGIEVVPIKELPALLTNI